MFPAVHGIVSQGGVVAPPPATASLTRTTSGLIFMDLFDDGDVSDWTDTGSLASSVLESGNRYGAGALRTSVNAGTNGHATYRTFTEHTGDFVAQYWARQNIAKTCQFVFTDDLAAALAETNLAMVAFFRASPQQLQVYNGSSIVNLGAYATSTWYKLTHVVDVSAGTADSYLDDVLKQDDFGIAGAISGVSAVVLGVVGGIPTRVTDFDNIVLAKGHEVTCTNLPTGYSLRCTGFDGETKTETETSGTATVDVLLLDWPLIRVEVLDASGDAVAAFEEYAVGGDAFAFADGTADPDAEALAVYLTGAGQGRSVGITPHKAAYDATSGKTFFVYLGPGRDLYASSIDHSTGSIATPVKVADYPISDDDDHGSPSMVIDSSGILHVVWGSHNSVHKYSRSDNARDISAWTTTSLTGAGTYPDISIDPDSGDLYIIDRSGVTHPAHALGTLRVSSDGGDTWSAAATIVDTSGSPEAQSIFYPAGSQWSGGRLHFVWTVARGSPDFPRLNLYHAAYDPDDGHLYTAGGTDLGTSIDWTDHTSCLAIDSGTDRATVGSITADASGIYLTANVGSLTETYVHTAVWDGSAWTVKDTGIRQSHIYAGSAIRAHSGTLYLLACERDTGAGDTYTKLNLYTSSDGGSSWSFARTILDTLQAAGIERLQPQADDGPFIAIAQAEFEAYVQAAIAGSAPAAIGYAAPLFGVLEPW